MGPSMIVDGEETSRGAAQRRRRASMGPSMIVDGELKKEVFGKDLIDASMGLSMIVDGERPWGSWSERCTGRFNGAVDDRRRRVLSAASDEQPEVHASMGP